VTNFDLCSVTTVTEPVAVVYGFASLILDLNGYNR